MAERDAARRAGPARQRPDPAGNGSPLTRTLTHTHPPQLTSHHPTPTPGPPGGAAPAGGAGLGRRDESGRRAGSAGGGPGVSPPPPPPSSKWRGRPPALQGGHRSGGGRDRGGAGRCRARFLRGAFSCEGESAGKEAAVGPSPVRPRCSRRWSCL